jgi:hypothetical protein
MKIKLTKDEIADLMIAQNARLVDFENLKVPQHRAEQYKEWLTKSQKLLEKLESLYMYYDQMDKAAK